MTNYGHDDLIWSIFVSNIEYEPGSVGQTINDSVQYFSSQTTGFLKIEQHGPLKRIASSISQRCD